MGQAGFGQCHRVGLQFGCMVRRALDGGKEARGLEAIRRAQDLFGAHQTLVDRRLGEGQATGDLLGAVVLIDQTQARPLAFGQPGDF